MGDITELSLLGREPRIKVSAPCPFDGLPFFGFRPQSYSPNNLAKVRWIHILIHDDNELRQIVPVTEGCQCRLFCMTSILLLKRYYNVISRSKLEMYPYSLYTRNECIQHVPHLGCFHYLGHSVISTPTAKER